MFTFSRSLGVVERGCLNPHIAGHATARMGNIGVHP